MSRVNVPGQHSACDLYAALSRRYRPTDPAAIAAECRRLCGTGLKPRDVAQALRIDLAAVVEALRGTNAPLIPPTTGEIP